MKHFSDEYCLPPEDKNEPDYKKLYEQALSHNQKLVKELDNSQCQLEAYTQLASKGIYYTLEELEQHDHEVRLRALGVMKRIAAQFNTDPRDHTEFFETLWYELSKRQE